MIEKGTFIWKLIAAQTTQEFVREMNEAFEDGWKKDGEFQVCGGAFVPLFVQLLSKYVPNPQLTGDRPKTLNQKEPPNLGVEK